MASAGTSRSGGVRPDAGADADTTLDEDDLFEVLSNPRRRYAVHALKREDIEPEIGTLAEHIAAWENDQTVTEVTGSERKRVYTALQQSHLPKMDEAGVIDYDSDRGVVEATPALEEVDIYLDVIHEKDIPWSQYYLGLGGVCAALLTVAWAGVWPFAILPEIAWGVFVTVAFLVSAAVHYRYGERLRLGSDGEPPGPD